MTNNAVREALNAKIVEIAAIWQRGLSGLPTPDDVAEFLTGTIAVEIDEALDAIPADDAGKVEEVVGDVKAMGEYFGSVHDSDDYAYGYAMATAVIDHAIGGNGLFRRSDGTFLTPGEKIDAIRARYATLSTSKVAGSGMDDGWQPIETAPKDGTNILLYADVWGMTWGEIQIGHFDGTEWITGEGSVLENETDFDPDAEVEDKDYEDYDESNIGPTHWQPLPAAPHAETEGRRP